jgi:hypothetical protein
MNDQELLELAAKAAGERIYFDVDGDCYLIKTTPVLEQWNPLAYDCDAFRLAVKLNMGISIPIHQTIRADVICFKNSAINVREEGDDPYAATRRAIVRVAAEIGKSMGES